MRPKYPTSKATTTAQINYSTLYDMATVMAFHSRTVVIDSASRRRTDFKIIKTSTVEARPRLHVGHESRVMKALLVRSYMVRTYALGSVRHFTSMGRRKMTRWFEKACSFAPRRVSQLTNSTVIRKNKNILERSNHDSYSQDERHFI